MAFWKISEIGGERRVIILKASGSLEARIKAAMAGLTQTVLEVHELDANIARKVPKKAIGRVLFAEEAQSILARLS